MPVLLNPVQIIGISRKIKITPCGKHTGKTIGGLPDWVQKKYEYCPFSAKNDRKEPNDDEMLPEIDNSIIEIYNLLKSQFDRIVYIIGKELKIQCTSGFWGKVLQQFIINNGHFYPWLTEVNLPYIFAYLGMRHNNVWNQKFLVGSDIYNKLAAHSDVMFIKNEKKETADNSRKMLGEEYEILKNRNGCFINMFFRFTRHIQKASDGETLRESMLFCIDDRKTEKPFMSKE